MRQSQTYRKSQKGNYVMNPDKYDTYRNGMAWRILRKNRGEISPHDAWQLAAVPAFFLWIFRGPIGFFKRRKADRMLRKKLEKSNNNQRQSE